MIRNYKNVLFSLKHDFSKIPDPGSYGFEDGITAEKDFYERINAIHRFVRRKVCERRIEDRKLALAEQKTASQQIKKLSTVRGMKNAIKELEERGIAATKEDYNYYLPLSKQSELVWLEMNYAKLHKYNDIKRKIDQTETSLKKAADAALKLDATRQRLKDDPALGEDGLDDIYAYWRKTISSMKKHRETAANEVAGMTSESGTEPLSAKCAELLPAGRSMSEAEARQGYIPPVFDGRMPAADDNLSHGIDDKGR